MTKIGLRQAVKRLFIDYITIRVKTPYTFNEKRHISYYNLRLTTIVLIIAIVFEP